ncbi:Bacterial extracellular solute-binding protein, family 3 [compost metagenome]
MRVLLLLLSLYCGGLALADEVELSNGDWPPYLGENLPHRGVASRIISEAFALEGIDVQWKFYPWARALHLAQRGELAGSAVWLRSPEREAQFFISDPVIDSHYLLFYRKDHPIDWQQIDDLVDLRLGATSGYDYGEAFQRAEAEGRLQVRRQTSDELGLRQLLAGRIDAIPLDKVVAYALLHEHFSAAERAQIGFHPRPLRSDTLHLLLSRRVAGNAELMARFNQGLAQLRDSGKVAQYLREVEQSVTLAP